MQNERKAMQKTTTHMYLHPTLNNRKWCLNLKKKSCVFADLLQSSLADGLSWKHQSCIPRVDPRIFHVLCDGMDKNLDRQRQNKSEPGSKIRKVKTTYIVLLLLLYFTALSYMIKRKFLPWKQATSRLDAFYTYSL